MVASRELSFVPRRRPAFEAHDAQTRALMRRLAKLERLPHGHRVSALLSEWDWTDKMKSAEEKQRFLEPLIAAVRRDPEANEDALIFLMLAFEPVRRNVSKAFMGARAGLAPRPCDVDWTNRTEARLMRDIEREQLFDVTREAALEAVFRYPPAPPRLFFPWLRETIAHRALDRLRGELPELEISRQTPAEAEALQEALAGFEQAGQPELRDRAGMRAWRMRISMRDVFAVVEEFFDHDAIRAACREAVGRLPRGQRDVVEGYFFEQVDVPGLAACREVSASTIYNQKAQAQKRLHDDDVFFSALCSLGRVRDRARAQHIAQRYPDGRRPDGRRIVVIDRAA